VNPEILYATWFFCTALPGSIGGDLLSAVFVLGVAPGIIVLLVRTEKPVRKSFIWLGAISYPLYASHFAVINVASSVLLRQTEKPNVLWAIPMMGAALLIAWVIERLTAHRSASAHAEFAAI
jgi:peptidoglycan/LPS O-acetylase OafA/YrhL